MAATKKLRTASGHLAAPIENEPLRYLVKVRPGTWWVIELHHRDGRIQDIDLDDFSYGKPWGICASAHKLTRKYHEVTHPGWYVEVEGHDGEPYPREADAVAAMLEVMDYKRIQREQRAAEQRERTVNRLERLAESLGTWSREYTALEAAVATASAAMRERGLWSDETPVAEDDPSWDEYNKAVIAAYETAIAAKKQGA